MPNTTFRTAASAAFFAAIAPLLFSVAFFVLLPRAGLDLARFGDAAHVLTVFGDNPLLLRAIGLNNVVLMVCSVIVASSVPRWLTPHSQSLFVSGLVASLGWGTYLVGEALDLTAYLSLPPAFRAGVTGIELAFQTLQHAGRITHMFAYLLIGLGMVGLCLRLPSGLRVLGLLAASSCVATFLVECFGTSLSGDAGAGGLFNALLAADTLLLAAWHGWLGFRLWRTP